MDNSCLQFKIWIESINKMTFDNIRKSLEIQLHPIKIKNENEFNQKRINEFDLKMIRGKIHDWALFQDKLSSIAKMQINKYLDKGNGTLADIVNSIINDYKR